MYVHSMWIYGHTDDGVQDGWLDELANGWMVD